MIGLSNDWRVDYPLGGSWPNIWSIEDNDTGTVYSIIQYGKKDQRVISVTCDGDKLDTPEELFDDYGSLDEAKHAIEKYIQHEDM